MFRPTPLYKRVDAPLNVNRTINATNCRCSRDTNRLHADWTTHGFSSGSYVYNALTIESICVDCMLPHKMTMNNMYSLAEKWPYAVYTHERRFVPDVRLLMRITRAYRRITRFQWIMHVGYQPCMHVQLVHCFRAWIQCIVTSSTRVRVHRKSLKRIPVNYQRAHVT